MFCQSGCHRLLIGGTVRKTDTHTEAPAEWSNRRADDGVLVDSDELMICEDIQGLFGSLGELHI